jgi:hypothetical protein
MKVPTSGLTFAVAVLLLFSATADAAMLGWWRFGDDDGGLAAPPVDGADIGPGSAANQRTVNHMGGLEGMYFQTALPEYSVVVPMKQGISDIYDPYTDTTLSNAWSMYTPGAGQERLRPGTVAVPTTFTFETFVQPQSVHTMVIVNHQSSTTNGWRVTLNSNGSVAAHLYAGGNGTMWRWFTRIRVKMASTTFSCMSITTSLRKGMARFRLVVAQHFTSAIQALH